MGCLKRYTKPVDGTIPIPALLYDDEDLLASQDGLGIYDGWVSFVKLLPIEPMHAHICHKLEQSTVGMLSVANVTSIR